MGDCFEFDVGHVAGLGVQLADARETVDDLLQLSFVVFRTFVLATKFSLDTAFGEVLGLGTTPL